MIKILFISIVLLAAAMIMLGLNILFRKNGKFPVYSIGHNRNMHKLGISCVKHDEIVKNRKYQDEECCGCGVSLCCKENGKG